MSFDGLQMAGDPVIYIELAKTYKENGDIPNALSLCENALRQKMSPDRAKDAYFFFIDILAEIKDFKRMEFEVEHIKELYNDTPVLIKEIIDYIDSKKEEYSRKEEVLQVSSEDMDDDNLIIEHTMTASVSFEENEQKEEKQKTDKDENVFVHGDGSDEEKELQSILSAMDNTKGVMGLLLLSEEGFLITSRLYQKIKIDSTVMLLSGICMTADNSLKKSEMGQLQRGVIEIGKGRIYIFRGNGYYLVLISDDSVKMGLILIKIKKIVSKINEVVT